MADETNEKEITEAEIAAQDEKIVEAIAEKLYAFDQLDYSELSEDEKEIYRIKADEILAIIDNQN